jgi:uncharacterized glyoxalase superfamily protein PhnB
MKLPQNHQAVMPYLMLPNAAAFLTFTQTVFDATLSFSEMQEDSTKYRHAEISISGATIMFCDTVADWGEATAQLFVYVPSADEAYHKAIAAGAASVMPLSDQSYGRTCGVRDSNGNVWWITSV